MVTPAIAAILPMVAGRLVVWAGKGWDMVTRGVILPMVAGRVVVAMAREETIQWVEILRKTRAWVEHAKVVDTEVKVVDMEVKVVDTEVKVVDMAAKVVDMAAKEAAATTTTSSSSRELLASVYGRF